MSGPIENTDGFARNAVRISNAKHQNEMCVTDNAAHVRITDDLGDDIEKDNPLPVQDIDASGRYSTNTVFGEKIVGTRI
jgi:hypothetical protein